MYRPVRHKTRHSVTISSAEATLNLSVLILVALTLSTLIFTCFKILPFYFIIIMALAVSRNASICVSTTQETSNDPIIIHMLNLIKYT